MPVKKAEMTAEERMALAEGIIQLDKMLTSVKEDFKDMMSMSPEEMDGAEEIQSYIGVCREMSEDSVYDAIKQEYSDALLGVMQENGITDKMLADVYKVAKVSLALTELSTKLIAKKSDEVATKYGVQVVDAADTPIVDSTTTLQ